MGASAALGAKVGSGSGSGSRADLDLRVFLMGLARASVSAAATGDPTLRATGDAATGEAGGMGESLHTPSQSEPRERERKEGREEKD